MSNGIINFRAAIVSESMTIPLASRAIESVDPGPSGDIFVNMGQVIESQLSGVGSAAAPVMFEMRFENQHAQKVRVTFNGNASDVISGVLTTTNSTVGIQLSDESGNIVPVNEAREYELHPGQNILRFASRLVGTHDKVLPGDLGAVAMFTLAYM